MFTGIIAKISGLTAIIEIFFNEFFKPHNKSLTGTIVMCQLRLKLLIADTINPPNEPNFDLDALSFWQ